MPAPNTSDIPERHAETQPAPQTLWHRLLGTLLEELLSPVGISVQTEVQVMSEPPRADILLLRREGARWTPAQRERLPDGVQDSRASHVLLEFKYTESINLTAFVQALVYDYLYRQSQQLSDADIQTFVLSARTPRPAVLTKLGYSPTKKAGVYHSDNVLLKEVPLLVLNELSNEPHNAFVKCFASRRTAKGAAFGILEQVKFISRTGRLWTLISGLRAYWFGAKGAERMSEQVLTPEIVLEMGEWVRKTVISHMTIEELLAERDPQEVQQALARGEVGEPWRSELLSGFTVEERLAGLDPEERLAGLDPEERLAGLDPEERLAGLDPEERLAGLDPEERLAGLPIETIEAYLREQKAQAQSQPGEGDQDGEELA
jgi:hypothetical protein